MLYPTGCLRNALKQHPELQVDVFEGLQRTNPAQLRAEGRVYGGGLNRPSHLVPGTCLFIPARLVLDSVKTHVRIEEQTSMFA